MRLKDRVAIITGGGGGIGRSLALGFGKEGGDSNQLILVGHNPSLVEVRNTEVPNDAFVASEIVLQCLVVINRNRWGYDEDVIVLVGKKSRSEKICQVDPCPDV